MLRTYKTSANVAYVNMRTLPGTLYQSERPTFTPTISDGLVYQESLAQRLENA